MVDIADMDCLEILANSAPPPPEYDFQIRVLITVVLCCFQFVCIAGNATLILSVSRTERLRTRTIAFVISLAVADIGVGVLVMPFAIYQQYTNKYWYLGETFCLVTTSLDVMFCTVSIFHLGALCIDRYLAIIHPFLHVKMTVRHVVAIICMSWLIPVFISFVPIMNKWNTIGIEDFISCVLPPENVCVFFVNKEFAFICSSIAFYIPVVFMTYCYWKIYQCARRQFREIKKLTHTQERETKAAKTLGIIMGCFSLCWFPFFVFNLIDPVIGYQIPYIPWTVALWLGYINSMMNPFLYYKFNSTFRHSMRKFICCEAYLKRVQSEVTDTSHTHTGATSKTKTNSSRDAQTRTTASSTLNVPQYPRESSSDLISEIRSSCDESK